MRKRLGQLVIIIFVILLLTGISSLKLPTRNLLLLYGFTLLLGVIHWDLTDGGLVSRVVYNYTNSVFARNLITVFVALSLTVLFIVVSRLYIPPYLSIIYIPIILATVRGGLKFGVSTTLVAAAVFLFIFRNMSLPPNLLTQNIIQIIFMVLVGILTGVLVNRMYTTNVHLGGLYESGKIITGTLQIEEVANKALNIIKQKVSPDSCALMLSDGNHLNVKASYGVNEEQVKEIEIRDNKTAIGWAVKHNQSIYISDAKEDPPMACLTDEARSIIAAPLFSNGKVRGVLVTAKQKPFGFTYEDLRFLEGIAAQTNNALENADRYQETEQSAIRDGLTGLYNYRHFSQELASAITKAEKQKSPVSLIIIDIDYFKQINDNHGHMRGDEVLRYLARLLQNRTREEDLVARYGGEEFVVLLPQVKYEDAFIVACKLRQIVMKTIFRGRRKDSKPIHLTISLGVSTYPLTASNKEQLLKQADEALYEAKLYRNTACSPFECCMKE